MTVTAIDTRTAIAPARSSSWVEHLRNAVDPGWRPSEWDSSAQSFVGMHGSPRTLISICARAGCGFTIDGPSGLCSGCRKAWSRIPHELGKATLPPLDRAEVLSSVRLHRAGSFSLDGLSEVLRYEMLLGLQSRDREGHAVRPLQVRLLAGRISPELRSLIDMPDAGLPGLQRALLRDIQQHLRRLSLTYSGSDGTAGDIWDCALVGLQADRSRHYVAVTGVLDFGVIRQRWLRQLTKGALSARRPPVTECQRYIQAASIASSVLTGRPNGDHPERLEPSDMAAICRSFRSASDPTSGRSYSESHRRAIHGWWRRLIDFARAGGLMDSIPGTFAVTGDHQFGPSSLREDEIGRAIPEEWITYLNGHVHLLGTTTTYEPAGWPVEAFRDMLRVFYEVLRDTGRRPSEIARLSDQPVEHTRGGPSLIYDNRKAGRHGRRLPIDASTADGIAKWQARLAALPIPLACSGYLFPAPGARNRERRGHLNAALFGKMLAHWLTIVPTPSAFSDVAAAFPMQRISSYAFRHAYAQRHADNGTPVDVLRDLMDHREVETTMGYYQVSLRRKQNAVNVVAQLALNRHGTAAPFADQLAYERASVATTYGNCTEPNNVKAGGKSCPIRFQCSGCGFYRPDPSYLAAIEQQVAQLRADRAIAIAADVAEWVLDNLNEQIKSYDRIAATMNKMLASMPDEQRSAVESACSDLRRARDSVVVAPESLWRRPNDHG